MPFSAYHSEWLLTHTQIIQTDLHSIGGLDPLLGYLKTSHAGIRAKAAEVVSTIVQNNPKSQQLVMESNGLEPLLTNFKSDPSTNARTKALGAISCKYKFCISIILCQDCAVNCTQYPLLLMLTCTLYICVLQLWFVITSLEYLHFAWEMAMLDWRMLLVLMMPDFRGMSLITRRVGLPAFCRTYWQCGWSCGIFLNSVLEIIR